MIMENHQISLFWLNLTELLCGERKDSGQKGYSDITDFGVEKGF